MQFTVNRIKGTAQGATGTISGVIGIDKYSLPFTKEAYADLVELEGQFADTESLEDAKAIIETAKLLTARDSKTELETICPALKFDSKSNKFYLHQNGVTSTIPVPKPLVDMILSSVADGLSFEPVVKCWINFLRNPNFSLAKANYFGSYLTTTTVDQKEKKRLIDEEGYSEDKATELATYNDISITRNGMLSTYKYAKIVYNKFDPITGQKVNRYEESFDEETGERTIKLPEVAEDYTLSPPVMGESGDAFYAGASLAHRIKVGAIHRLEGWHQVNTNDSSSCVKGLHLGGRRYVQSFGGGDAVLLNCLVNPMHIGAFDHSGNGAVRVLEYVVHSAVFAPNKNKYSESNYAAHTDAQWADMRADAIAKSEDAINKLKGAQTQLSAF